MRILIGCEFSGRVRDAFAAQGHDAWSCDLLPSERPGNHIQGELLGVLGDGWDLMIAHPPCTYLSVAGNRHMKNPGRVELREDALRFFIALWNAPIERICLENPVGYVNTAFRKPDQIIHPYFFGERQLKRTCLWLKNLPKLHYALGDTLFEKRTATDYPEPIYRLKTNGKRIHFTEAVKGWAKRSKTFDVIAQAMAEQWGNP